MNGPPATGSDATRFFGGCLLAAGVLMTLLCGLCTLVVIGGSLISAKGRYDAGPAVVMGLIFGGIPIAIGVGLMVIGRSLLRERKRPSPEKTAKEFE